jgi:hypothetical protein
MRRTIVLIVLTVFVIGLLTGAYIVVTGVSARPQPSTLEMRTAHAMRSIAIRARLRGGGNPVPASADVVEEGMEHFADHCAGVPRQRWQRQHRDGAGVVSAGTRHAAGRDAKTF